MEERNPEKKGSSNRIRQSVWKRKSSCPETSDVSEEKKAPVPIPIRKRTGPINNHTGVLSFVIFSLGALGTGAALWVVRIRVIILRLSVEYCFYGNFMKPPFKIVQTVTIEMSLLYLLLLYLFFFGKTRSLMHKNEYYANGRTWKSKIM